MAVLTRPLQEFYRKNLQNSRRIKTQFCHIQVQFYKKRDKGRREEGGGEDGRCRREGFRGLYGLEHISHPQFESMCVASSLSLELAAIGEAKNDIRLTHERRNQAQ